MDALDDDFPRVTRKTWRRLGMRAPKPRKPGHIDVRAIRDRMDMSRADFAANFGISLATLRHWENGERKPRGAALILLHVIAMNPAAARFAYTRACRAVTAARG